MALGILRHGAVERWLAAEARRVRLVAWSGRLLVAAVGLAGVTALAVLGTDRTSVVASVELTDGAKRAASVSVGVVGAEPGRTLRVRAVAEAPGRPARTVLAAAVTADRAGAATLRTSIADLAGIRAVRVEVTDGDRVVSAAYAELAPA